MAGSLFYEVRTRYTAEALKTTMGGLYEAKAITFTGTVLSSGAVLVGGQRYQFSTSGTAPAVGTELALANMGRPGAAWFAPISGGGVVTVSGSGSSTTGGGGHTPSTPGTTTTEHGALSELLDDDHTQYLLANGTRAMTGALTTVGRKLAVTVQTDSYTATTLDDVIICNKASAMTVTLPAATGGGQAYRIKSIGAGAVTVDGNSTDTIDGELTQALAQWEAITLVDYAANAWAIL